MANKLKVEVISPGYPIAETDGKVTWQGAVVRVIGLNRRVPSRSKIITLHPSVTPEEYACTSAQILSITKNQAIDYEVIPLEQGSLEEFMGTLGEAPLGVRGLHTAKFGKFPFKRSVTFWRK